MWKFSDIYFIFIHIGGRIHIHIRFWQKNTKGSSASILNGKLFMKIFKKHFTNVPIFTHIFHAYIILLLIIIFQMVIMYFGVSVVNNWALSFDIPMPLHMIFRAGSLIANMIMGMLILGRRYTKIKYLAVLAIR